MLIEWEKQLENRGKVKGGWKKQLALVEGDVNLLTNGEILITKEEGYNILRKRLDSGEIETYVVVPLRDFKKDAASSRKKMEKT